MQGDDDDLARALEESAKLHSATVHEVHLNTQIFERRLSLPMPQHHWASALPQHPHPLQPAPAGSMWSCDNCQKQATCTHQRCAECDYDICDACASTAASPDRQPQDGIIFQIDLLNQFCKVFHSQVQEFDPPRALCGYFTMAHCLLLPRLLPKAACSRAELVSALAPLNDDQVVGAAVAEAVRAVYLSRTAWLDAHSKDFTPVARQRYLSAWVANFEISDWLREKSPPGVYFARYNQWPEFGVSTHEEAERLIEEKQFGGKTGPEGNVYGPGEAVFFVEQFRPWKFLRPEEFNPPLLHPLVLAADLNGHFVTCAALKLREGETEVPMLLVLNTTGTKYADHCGYVFDLCFHPEAAVANGQRKRIRLDCLEGVSPSPNVTVDLSARQTEMITQVQALGFTKVQAQAALQAVQYSSIEAAVDKVLELYS